MCVCVCVCFWLAGGTLGPPPKRPNNVHMPFGETFVTFGHFLLAQGGRCLHSPELPRSKAIRLGAGDPNIYSAYNADTSTNGYITGTSGARTPDDIEAARSPEKT